MFNSWPSIESFHRVRKDYDSEFAPKKAVQYRGKVKLHGTNAGINILPDGRVLPQSRSSLISSGNDNAGFAAWVENNESVWAKNALKLPITVYGEWCGAKIQKGVAISSLDTRVFAIFAIQIGRSDNPASEIIYDPRAIRDALDVLPDNTYVLPWHTETLSVNFEDTEDVRDFANVCEQFVEEVEQRDPWVKEVFNVDGTGEGLVFYPVNINEGHDFIERALFKRFVFKAKGEKHKVVKTRKGIEINPVVAASVDEFIDTVVTDARLEQAVREANGGKLVFDKARIGPFIGWFQKDVKKDLDNGEITLPEGVEWKLVIKPLTNRVCAWFVKKYEEI